jgi:hypothetical protein
LISHQHKCIFIHQRKCAGISIMRSFGCEPPDPLAHFLNDGVLSPEYSWHDAVVPGYFKFTVVRNPWDRFISGWLYCENTRDKPIDVVLAELPSYTGHDYTHLTRLQRDVLFDAEGKPIYHFLVRFENLQEDFDLVCDHIGKPRTTLPHANSNRDRRPYQEYFHDWSTRERFERHFARDIDTFMYTFGGR